MTFKQEENNWNVTLQDVIKINTDEGDTLLVTLPEQSQQLPNIQLDNMFQRVGKAFEKTFADKDVKVVVVPYGMKVELIKSSK
jgi:hypothetical protein